MKWFITSILFCLLALTVEADVCHDVVKPEASTALESAFESSDVLEPQIQRVSCCKICTTGQACGDSCISWEKVCRKGVGCACQGFEETPAELLKI